jgi:hypothetical protein
MSKLPPEENLENMVREIVNGTSPLTAARRARFEEYGEKIIRQDLGNGALTYIGGPSARKAAIQWLREIDIARSNRRKIKDRWIKMGVILAALPVLVTIELLPNRWTDFVVI